MDVRLVTLKIKGVRQLDKQTEVGQLVPSLRCDFLFIQRVHFVSHRELQEFKAYVQAEAFFSFVTRRCMSVRVIVFDGMALWPLLFLVQPDGRVLCFDLMTGCIRHRCINVYEPAQRGMSIWFYRDVAVHLLIWEPTILLRIFNCVPGWQRDVCGPGEGRSI